MNILWLKTELLHPIDKGGKIRSYGMLKELKGSHRITYLTLDSNSTPETVGRAEEYCHELIRVPHELPPKFSLSFYLGLLANATSRLPYALRAYRSPRMRELIQQQVDSGEVDLVVCDFLTPSPNVPDGLAVPTLLFQHNVESMIWRRHFEVQKSLLRRAFFWMEWSKMRRAEERECQRHDKVVAVSKDDAEELEGNFGAEGATYVLTGVDTEYFSPSNEVEANPLEIIFTGSMDWLPNQDAVDYFLEEVLPTVMERIPGVRFTIVGRTPPQSLMERADKDPSITVTGFVDDVRPYVERAAVFVVPIRVGGGTRLKVFEAMSMGKPVVSTTVGAEGLPLRPGDDIIISDDPGAMADAIVGLLTDPALAKSLGARSAALVREKYGWDAVSRDFSRICSSLVEGGIRKGRGPEERVSDA